MIFARFLVWTHHIAALVSSSRQQTRAGMLAEVAPDRKLRY